jgi:hypothetical protein
MPKKVDYLRMKPIWYFVGLILISMGAVINLSGLYDLFHRAGGEKTLGYLHTNVWWGELMVVVGALFVIFNRKPRAARPAARVKGRAKSHA